MIVGAGNGEKSAVEFVEGARGYFKTCSGLRQKSQLAFKTKGILANPTTMIARF
jgi:hypothetical protein